MGMYAMYQEVKKEDFKKLLESDDFFETIEELEEKDGTELCDIDKMWDALHFLLNGLSAIHGTPEDNLLSEFIIGSESFDEESEDFTRYIPTERVIEIAKKLNEINFEDYLKDFDMNKFAENGIYPDIWSYDDEREEIMEELSEHFETLKEFYNKVAKNKNIVVVTIC
ncbi:YfbM family protein [Fusobacterium periodonticum]|uniref:YfbM family protein n=1 Tax=Fusobacterium periodonticum TaxID=860 RepID=UPI0028D43449|nr:YfbM family protein [Fusobacterium periodonticum]